MAKTKENNVLEVTEMTQKELTDWVISELDSRLKEISSVMLGNLEDISQETFEDIVSNKNSHSFEITQWDENGRETARTYANGIIVRTKHNQYNHVEEVSLDGKVPDHIEKRIKTLNYRKDDFRFLGETYT